MRGTDTGEITLDREVRARVARALKAWLQDEHDLEIGDLGSQLLLDFVLKSVGPVVYNQAIKDAQAFLSDKLLDMETSLYRPEITPEK